MASGGGSPGAYRHVILAKLKEDVPKETLQEKLKLFAILPTIVPGMKSFHWGIDESVKIKHKGFSYVFEATFDSMDDISNYYEHPGHLAFANQVSSVVDDYIVVNYKPISITNQE